MRLYKLAVICVGVAVIISLLSAGALFAQTICSDSNDDNGDGWGYENGESCKFEADGGDGGLRISWANVGVDGTAFPGNTSFLVFLQVNYGGWFQYASIPGNTATLPFSELGATESDSFCVKIQAQVSGVVSADSEVACIDPLSIPDNVAAPKLPTISFY